MCIRDSYIPGCRQQAVRFVILRAEGSDPPVYDSGWRKTSLCQHQPEQPLESRTAYVWYAEVRDMAGNLPVSYTHLDVYKRQGWAMPRWTGR